MSKKHELLKGILHKVKLVPETKWRDTNGQVILFPLSILCHKHILMAHSIAEGPNIWIYLSKENLRAICKEAPIKPFPFWHYSCRVDPYLVVINQKLIDIAIIKYSLFLKWNMSHFFINWTSASYIHYLR